MKECFRSESRYRFQRRKRELADTASYVFFSVIAFMVIAATLYQIGFVIARSVK